MKKYRETKARKVIARLPLAVQSNIESCVSLMAKEIANGNEEAKQRWCARCAGAVDMLCTLGLITISEEMLVNEYNIHMAYEKADEIRNGAA